MEDEAQNAAIEFIAFAEAQRRRLMQELSDWQTVIEKTLKLTKISMEGRQDISISGQNMTPFTVIAPPHYAVIRRRKRRRSPAGSLKENAKTILAEFNRPMKTPEISREFHKRNLKLSEKNGNQILRGMFRDNQDVFRKVAEGEYGLVEWEIKKSEVSTN